MVRHPVRPHREVVLLPHEEGHNLQGQRYYRVSHLIFDLQFPLCSTEYPIHGQMEFARSSVVAGQYVSEPKAKSAEPSKKYELMIGHPVYRDGLKIGPVLLSNSQAGTGRKLSKPRAHLCIMCKSFDMKVEK